MSSTDEKKPRRGFFSKKPPSVKDSDAPAEKKSGEHDAVETTPTEKPVEVPPVAFTKLFR